MPQKSINTSMHCPNKIARVLLGLSIFLFSTSLVFHGAGSGSAAASGTVIDVSDVRAGMKGYGLTVFSGTEPERFGVEVIDVVPNFMLRQNIILIRCDHPITDRAGVIGGMSGSPIYLEGRLAGALAYGWQFNKEPVAGVTPISNMRYVLKRRLTGRTASATPGELARMLIPATDRITNIDTRFQPTPRVDPASPLLPAQTPVALSGFSGQSLQLLEETLSPFGMVPMQGGGAGTRDPQRDPQKFVPGGPIGVQLIRGDLSATGIGTVTTVDGKDILAFGHPMMNMGETYLPVTTARIHTVISSLMRSNKIGTPLSEIGSLTQDRSACIAARTDLRAAVIPVEISIDSGAPEVDDIYRVEVAAHRLLTDRLIQAAAAAILQLAVSDARDVTVEAEGILSIRGRAPIVVSDSGISRNGAGPLFAYLIPAVITGAILANPFEPVEVESLKLRFTVREGLSISTIQGIYTTNQEPAAGDVVNLYVRLLSYGGQERIVTVPLQIPLHTERQKLQITVAGGNFISPPMSIPENLDDLLANVRRLYPSRSLVVQTGTAADGITMRGALMLNLPGSAMHSLKPAMGKENTKTYNISHTEVIPSRDLIAGKETLTLTVGPRSRQ